jgi:hypothetical protein
MIPSHAVARIYPGNGRWCSSMRGLPWTCAYAGPIAAAVIVAIAVALVVLRQQWRRRESDLDVRMRAERAALDVTTDTLRESLLQSGQGLLLRFEAIARNLPENHPARHDLAAAIASAERVLEKGLDQAQDRRDRGSSPSTSPDAPST